MSYNFLKLRIENRVGWIEYNRPPINSFNWDKLREVPAALDDLLNDPQVRVIVFASANEKYFSTGADLKMKNISAPAQILRYLMASELKGCKSGFPFVTAL
jgi:enoyl-CoA hydratase/carnithine racemase